MYIDNVYDFSKTKFEKKKNDSCEIRIHDFIK